MQSIKQVKYALPSLVFSLLMSFVTTIHHIHSGLVLHPDSAALHVVLNEMVLIPATCLSMYFYLRNNSRLALMIYIAIAALGFIFLGLYEGGWNHTAKVIGYLRINSPSMPIDEILPRDNIHFWFYELTGVLTFICAMVASWYSLRFYLATKRRDGSYN